MSIVHESSETNLGNVDAVISRVCAAKYVSVVESLTTLSLIVVRLLSCNELFVSKRIPFVSVVAKAVAVGVPEINDDHEPPLSVEYSM